MERTSNSSDESDSAFPSSPSPEQRVVAVASAMLRGELGIIEGSRLLCALRFRVSSLHRDPDFLPFVVIDTETDHLPVGDVRQLWAADAVEVKDREIQASEAFYRECALAGCKRLLMRFSPSTDEESVLSSDAVGGPQTGKSS